MTLYQNTLILYCGLKKNNLDNFVVASDASRGKCVKQLFKYHMNLPKLKITHAKKYITLTLMYLATVLQQNKAKRVHPLSSLVFMLRE